MATETRTLEPLPIPEPEGPPARHLSPREWIKENLFSNAFDSVLTIVFAFGIGYLAFRTVRYLFVTGRWEIVERNLTGFMVLNFPRDQLWRPWAALFVLAIVIGLRWGVAVARRGEIMGKRVARNPREPLRRVWPLILLVVVVLAFSRAIVPALTLLALAGTTMGARAAGMRLPRRAWRLTAPIAVAGIIVAFEVIAGFGGVGFGEWRGLLLTMFLAVGGIVLSFPIGVLLALGRRSTFPAIRAVSVAYIELIRGVPLITLLFMAFLVLGFFLPPGTQTPALVTRALVALVMFTAAYVAEIVRGGLQSVPKGQIEAAQALGLSAVRTTLLIVLPQALRAVIPAMVGQFISLFKDTSLVGFIGLTELLGVAQTVTSQPDFLGRGLQAETLTFAAFIYWVGAYWMSKTSQRLERRLGVGER